MSIINSLRQSADNGFATVASTGLSPYSVYVVNIKNDSVSFDQSGTGRVRTNTLLTVGSHNDCCNTNIKNPHIQFLTKMDNNGVSVLSGGALGTMDVMLGPLAFPYTTSSGTFGTDPNIFQPGPTADAHNEIYVWITGIGLNDRNGNYFKVNEVVLNGMDNIFYYVRLSSISDVIP